MLSTKVFDHTINCKHPVKYVSNLEDNVKKDLDSQMKNKVFNNCYIKDIKSIDKISGVRISNTNPECPGYLNVRFTAKIVTYCKGDIIPKTIIRIHDNQYIAETDNISILLRPEIKSITKLLSTGQTIPVMLTGDATYASTNKKVTSVGTILMPNIKHNQYKIQGAINSALLTKLEPLVKLIEEQTPQLKGEAVEKISKLLSNKSKSTSKNNIDIIELLKKKDSSTEDIWSLDSSALYHSPVVTKITEDTSVIHTNVFEAFKQLLTSIYMRRNAVIELSKYSKEEWQSSIAIWKIMENN